ncbi:MAG: hypothetical protein D6757_04260 [Alphaproteobacteria bacterium]|nr:MAG: hypothetical protein D6757_04260 [Alphaproteobacteria bacterium]
MKEHAENDKGSPAPAGSGPVIFISVIGLLAVTGLVWLFVGPSRNPLFMGHRILAWSFAALLLITAVFGMLAWLFGSWKLASREHAFGMPPGTVRAFLAIAVLFSVMALSVYLVEMLGDPAPRQIDPGTQVQITEDGYYYTRGGHRYFQSNAGTAFAREIGGRMATALMTILAAVSSFYFASRAAQPNRPSSAAGKQAHAPGGTGTETSGSSDTGAGKRQTQPAADKDGRMVDPG